MRRSPVCASCHSDLGRRRELIRAGTPLCDTCLAAKAQLHSLTATNLGVELDTLIWHAIKVGELSKACKAKRVPWAAFYKEYNKLKAKKLLFLAQAQGGPCAAERNEAHDD